MVLVETSLSGGLKTWGMILIFAWSLAFLGILYEWIFEDSLNISSNVCKDLSYLQEIII
jgi:hypothetical protein